MSTETQPQSTSQPEASPQPEQSQAVETTPVQETVAPAAAEQQPQVTAADYAKFKAKADALKARENEFKQTAAKAAQLEQRLENLKQLAGSNPAAILDELGIDPQSLLDSLVAPYEDTTTKLQKEVAGLKSMLQKREEQAAAEAAAEHWANVQDTFASHVNSTPDLELLQQELKDDSETVFSTLRSMVEMANERGETLTFRQAAQKYEDYLLNLANRYASTNKIKARFAPAPAPIKQENQQAQQSATANQQAPENPKTITNAVAQEAAEPKRPTRELSPLEKKMLDEAERKRALIASITRPKE